MGMRLRGAVDTGYTGRMGSYPSLFGTPREWAIDLAIVTAIGVFLGLIGPFGSFYGGPAELRIAYWVANLWAGFIVMSVCVRLSLRLAIRMDLPAWFALAAGVAAGALPLAVLVDFFSAWVWPPNHGRLTAPVIQYSQVLVLSEPFAFGYYFLADRGWRGAVARARAMARTQAPAASPDAAPGTAPAAPVYAAFLDRLPARLGRHLLCLQMEDHFVRAHTPKGSDLILISLKDAMAELGDADGLQVHRSWWVARSAVEGSALHGRNLTLRLTNGLDAPVSRASVAKLRARGWLDGGEG